MRYVTTLILALLLTSTAIAQSVEADLFISVQTSGVCVGEGHCAPTTEFRVYSGPDQIGTVGIGETAQITLPFLVVVGQEYCFDVTEFNGLEGDSAQACANLNPARPDRPSILELRFRLPE